MNFIRWYPDSMRSGKSSTLFARSTSSQGGKASDDDRIYVISRMQVRKAAMACVKQESTPSWFTANDGGI